MDGKLLRLAALLSGVLIAGSAQAASATCERACLTDLITQYVDAVLAHDHGRLPLAAQVKYTEDTRLAQLGEGLWKSITARAPFRQDYIDVRRQVAASHLHLREGENHVLLSVVLHVEERRIAGIETLVQRLTPESRFQPRELGAPVRHMNDPLPAGKGHSREELIRIALTYTEGLRVGSFIDAGTPFAPHAYRVENGVITSGEGCGQADCGMYTQRQIVHPGIIPSVAAVDEEAGIVLLWMNFGYTGPSSIGENRAWVTFEAFKIWDGQIHSVLAFFPALAMSVSRFWPSEDPVPRMY